MVSYIWRSTDGQEDSNQQGTSAAAHAAGDRITFSKVQAASSGKYMHQTQLDFVVAIGENEKPKGNVNELQDTSLDSITWTLTGSAVAETGSSSVYQLIKTWLIDDKTDDVFTKGRFGLELDDIDSYDLIPTGTGTGGTAVVEQPRGYILTSWRWIRDGETKGKTSFIATLRFNGDVGVNTSTPKYSWTVNHS